MKQNTEPIETASGMEEVNTQLNLKYTPEVINEDVEQLLQILTEQERELLFILYRCNAPLSTNDVLMEVIASVIIDNWNFIEKSLLFGDFKVVAFSHFTNDERKRSDRRLGIFTAVTETPTFRLEFTEPEMASKIRKYVLKTDPKKTSQWVGNYLRTPFLSFAVKQTIKILRKNNIPVPVASRIENTLNSLQQAGFVGFRLLHGTKINKLWVLNPTIRKKIDDRLEQLNQSE